MYKYYSIRPCPKGAIFIPISSLPFVNRLKSEWDKLVSTTNIVRAYYAYKINNPHIYMPDALMTVRNALAQADMNKYGTDLQEAGLSWQEINALLF